MDGRREGGGDCWVFPHFRTCRADSGPARWRSFRPSSWHATCRDDSHGSRTASRRGGRPQRSSEKRRCRLPGRRLARARVCGTARDVTGGRREVPGWRTGAALALLIYATFGVVVVLADLIPRMSPGASTHVQDAVHTEARSACVLPPRETQELDTEPQRWREACMRSPVATAAEQTSRWRSRSTCERSLSRRRSRSQRSRVRDDVE
jgi:hypothetical protein